MKFSDYYLAEVTQDAFDKIADRMADLSPQDMPLGNVFGDRLRVAFAVVPETAQKLASSLEQGGFRPDFQSGTASKTTQTRQGPKEQKINIGRAIELMVKAGKLDRSYLNYWSQFGQSLRQARPDVSVVLSRSPVDLLRMSDFDKITSCHRQGREYFKCAVQEARDGGAIAYAVRTDDLRGVNLDEPEIFEDRGRGVRGIQPLARVRVRLFHSDKLDTALGLPELRVYGENIPGFRESVKEFLKGKYGPGRPRMKDFELVGGSYTDNMASDLFNDFFDDDLDSGDVSRRGGEDDDDHNEQMRQEIAEIHRRHANKFKNRVQVDYEEMDQDGPDDPVYFYWTGSAVFTFPMKDVNGNAWEKASEYQLAKTLNRNYNFKDVENFSLSSHGQEFTVYLDFRDDDHGGHPDDYRQFIQSMHDDVDDEYDKIFLAVREVLVQAGVLLPGHPERVEKVFDAGRFRHFQIDDSYVGDGKIITSEEIPLLTRREMSFAADDPEGHGVKLFGPKAPGVAAAVRNVAVAKVKQWWGGVTRNPSLPGMESTYRGLRGMVSPDVTLTWDRHHIRDDQMLAAQITFEFSPANKGKWSELLRGVRFFDDNFERLVAEIRQASVALVAQHVRSKHPDAGRMNFRNYFADLNKPHVNNSP